MCDTAASKGHAAEMLLSGGVWKQYVSIRPKGIVLNLEPLDVARCEDYVTCAIRKDSGDDPDDTHGVLVYAKGRA